MPPGLKAGDSHTRRVMPHSENVRRSILVTIMYTAAVATRPLSYSKVCDTFRPLLGQAAASRTDLGTESFVHFLVPSSARNRFVAQHVSEGRPACIEHGLRQSGLGESRGVHVSDGDVVEVSHDAMRGFVQEVVARILDARVEVGSEAFLVGALRLRQRVGKLAGQRTQGDFQSHATPSTARSCSPELERGVLVSVLLRGEHGRRNAREGQAIRRGAARVHSSLTTHNTERRFPPVVNDGVSAPKIR